MIYTKEDVKRELERYFAKDAKDAKDDTVTKIQSDIEKVFAQSDILKIFNFNMCDKNKGSKIVPMYAIIVFDFENKYLEEM